MSTLPIPLEEAIQASNPQAPRVTPADIKANISCVEYVHYVSPSGQVLRWAVITTMNGFAVTGKPSAAASSANDRKEIGERVAYENAESELYALMGYELRSRIAAQELRARQESPSSHVLTSTK